MVTPHVVFFAERREAKLCAYTAQPRLGFIHALTAFEPVVGWLHGSNRACARGCKIGFFIVVVLHAWGSRNRPFQPMQAALSQASRLLATKQQVCEDLTLPM